MKILKPLLTLAAIALLITSCNKTDEFAPEQNSTFPADGVIRVATSVANPQTRAGMTSDNLENFQMRIINLKNSDYSYYAWMNKNEGEWESLFPTAEPGTFEPLTMLWQNKTQPVNIYAVSGISTPLVEPDTWDYGYLISVSNLQNEESLVEQADILYMTDEIDPSTDLSNGKIQIKFNHRLSKLNLTVKMGTEFNKLVGGTANNLISDITVGGTNTKVKWIILTDGLFDYSTVQNITPWYNITAYKAGLGDTQQAQASYECILIPQTVAADDFTVSFKIGDRYFSWMSPSAVVLAADTQYNLTLNVGKDVVTVGGFTATPWTEADPQDLGTE